MLAAAGAQINDSDYFTETLSKRIHLVNILSLVCAGVGFLSLPFDYFHAPGWMIWEDALSFIFFLFVPALNYLGRTLLSRLFFLFLANLVIIVACSFMPPEAMVHVVFFALFGFSLMLFDFSEFRIMLITALVPVFFYFYFQGTQQTYAVYSALVNFLVMGLSITFLQKTNQDSENSLKQIRSQIIHSEKMTALGEMGGGLAHEINTPLMSLQLNASILKKQLETGVNDPEKSEILIQKIDSMISKIAGVTQSLQLFAHDSKMDPLVQVPLREVIDSTLALCQERFRSHQVEMQVESDSKAISLNCRPDQISQMLLHLLNNSFERVLELPGNKWIRISNASVNDEVLLSVTDSGNGIPLEIQKKIFQPFFTTKSAGKRMGLGLSVSKGIMKSHGGDLYLDRTSKNTRFVARFPKA